MTPTSFGLPPLTQRAPPRSWLLAGLPSAWPLVTVKPSITPESVTVAPAVMTWKLLSLETEGVPMSPERIVTLTAGSRSLRMVSVPSKPP